MLKLLLNSLDLLKSYSCTPKNGKLHIFECVTYVFMLDKLEQKTVQL